MLQTFSKEVSQAEALLRIRKTKFGHKHRHVAGPGRISAKEKLAHKNKMATERAKRVKWLRATNAYWRGLSDVHP